MLVRHSSINVVSIHMFVQQDSAVFPHHTNYLFHPSFFCCWYQKKNEDEDRAKVIKIFQDMLEVVTRDIMEDQLPRYKCCFNRLQISLMMKYYTMIAYCLGFIPLATSFCGFSLLLLQCGSIFESSHGGSYRRPEGMNTLDHEYLFQPSGAIKFPLQATDAWLEKV